MHRRHLFGLLGPGLAAVASATDENDSVASNQATADALDEDLAGAILTIDLVAIQENWRRLRAAAAGAECGAAVKANAYGLGMMPVARALFDAGCRTFFVARPREGERLRSRLSDATIYVLDGFFAGEPGHFEMHRLRPALISLDEARGWAAFCRKIGRRLPCALHVDTGINRLGFDLDEFAHLTDDEATMADLPVALLMSHLACSDESGHPMNPRQLVAFEQVRARLPRVPASLANSSGIFLGEDFTMDLVRPGLALYGGHPGHGATNPMRPVVRLEGVVMQVRTVAAGETVGYGATWQASRESRIALLGAGYKDGIPRRFSSEPGRPSAEVALDGLRCPVVGRISMDMMAVDVTEVPVGRVRQGTRMEIVGDTITLEEAASRAGTISYELLARLGSRFARAYIGAATGG